MDDDYKYIIIIQINRNYNKIKDINKNNNKDKIYSLPDINPNIDQIFIDNLNGNDNIGLKDLLDQNENDMKNIIDKLQKLLSLHKEKEDTKNELNSIIKDLNELIANNSDLLYQKQSDPDIIKQLEKLLEMRKRELNTSKKIKKFEIKIIFINLKKISLL